MQRLILIFSCFTTLVFAESREITPIIDGQLNDSIWQRIQPQRLSPTEAGVPEATGGEVRSAVTHGYLYFSARLPEPSGRLTARSIGINPNWENGEDHLRIHISVNLSPSDWILKVSPLGAYSLERKGQYIYPEKFFVAARNSKSEWQVELAAPLTELRSPDPDSIRISAERIRAMRLGTPEQRWRWPEHGPLAKVSILQPDEGVITVPVFQPASLGNKSAPLEVGRVDALPPTGSGWSDPPWSEVPSWKLLRNEPLVRLPRNTTEVKLIHNGYTLAVMARCMEPEGVRVKAKQRDGPVDKDDSFQVYLATSGSAYAQFAINPAGYLLDAVGETGGPYLSRPRTDWNTAVQGIAHQESGMWTARIDIPLDSVAKVLGETQIPRQWKILLFRFRPGRSGEVQETSVFPVIETNTPRCPARYQKLSLVDVAPKLSPLLPDSLQGGWLSAIATRVFSVQQRQEMQIPNMLDRHIRGQARRILEAERQSWDQVKTVIDWERFRSPRIEALVTSLGEFPKREPLQTRVVKEFHGNGYRRQDLVYQSRPGLWVTANLFLPIGQERRSPGIIIVHSHHRPKSQAELQDMGILWARAGCAVLVMDQIGHGERLQNYPWNREAYHSRYVMGMQLYLVGESLIKWMVWDIMRGVDLLLERQEINPQQIILLGAVAGGGDPAAVTAVLDPRIAAVAPFNFGECMPETPRFLPDKNQWPLNLADPGWGEWESTRCLPRSLADQFLPWLICASVAPRRFVYAFEMGWEVEELPAWERYQRVFNMYNARDHLDEAHGFGPFPGPGECTNIGPAQRQSLYPELSRWFDIPIPSHEPEDRRPETELTVLNPRAASELSMRPVHLLAREIGLEKVNAVRGELAKLSAPEQRRWVQEQWAKRLGDIEPNVSPQVNLHWKKALTDSAVEGISLAVEPDIMVPLLLLQPMSGQSRLPVVVVLSQGGKERLLTHRGREIEVLLKRGVIVCLPDVRGAGETSPDEGRGPDSEETTLAATQLMLGNTLLGARLKDLRTVIRYLKSRSDVDPQRIALWGDSDVPVNPSHFILDELPGWQVGPEIQHQAEPLGGLLAMLGALFDNSIRIVAVRHGLVSYLSILEDRFSYISFDVIVPGVLEGGDLADLAAALSPRPMLLESLVDGRNRLVSQNDLRKVLAPVYAAYRNASSSLLIRTVPDTPSLVEWVLSHL